LTKALLVGNGAREHALAEALVKGGAELYSYMPLENVGIKKLSSKFTIGKIDDNQAIAGFARENGIELAIIGPEAPLAAGVVDALETAGVRCVGPTQSLARLESSKGFTRELLKKHRIDASPKFHVFEKIEGIKEYLEELGQYVLKPDGLTGGKGVKVFGEHILDNDEALEYCSEVLETHGRIVIEEKLEGEEFSLQTLTDGDTFLHFPPVQDHKRAYDGDRGPNTGGMGSYSDANLLLPFLNEKDILDARAITEKVAAALKKDYEAYKGVMYGGFIKTKKGVKLIEYNARFGDPETMNVIPVLKTNFLSVCQATAEGRLSEIKGEFEKKATVCKYIVPEGYPDEPKTGKIAVPNGLKAKVYFASVEERADGIYTTKSRAIALVGIADSISEAEKIAEEAASKIKGRVYHRKDIGTEQLLQKRVEHMKNILGEQR
jgi:phosphoribosylamine---glycine ligase